jgi:hypothetical protein
MGGLLRHQPAYRTSSGWQKWMKATIHQNGFDCKQLCRRPMLMATLAGSDAVIVQEWLQQNLALAAG